MRLDGDGVEIDAANQVADLIAAPLVPERIVLRRGWRSGGDAVAPLKPRHTGFVVADVSSSRGRLTGDGNLWIADAIQVQPVNVVITYQMQQDVRRICRRVRVAQVQPEFRADPMSLEADAIGPIRQQRARQPVVRPLDDLPRDRVVTAVK